MKAFVFQNFLNGKGGQALPGAGQRPPVCAGNGNPRMQIVRFDHVMLDGDDKDAWNAWADKKKSADIFRHLERIEAWRRLFGREHEAGLLAAYQDDRLVGILPWMRRTCRLAGKKIRILQFLADEIPPACCWIADPLLEAEVAAAILDYFRTRHADWDVIDWPAWPQQAWKGMRAVLSGCGLPWHEKARGREYRLQLANVRWDQYFDALPAGTKNLFLRQERFLKQVKIQRLSGCDMTPEILGEIMALDGRTPDGNRAEAGFFSTRRREAPVDQILQDGLREFTWFALFYLEDELIGYSCGFDHQGNMSEYAAGVARAFGEFSLPGYMRLKNIEHALATHHKSVAFCQADHLAGQSLGAQGREVCGWTVYRTRRLKLLHLSLCWLARVVCGSSRCRVLLETWCGRTAGNIRTLSMQCAEQHISPPRLAWRRFKKAAKRIFFAMDYYWLTTVIKDITMPELPAPMYKNLVLRELTLADYSRMEPLVSEKDLPARIRRFWEDDQCWGAILDGQVIGYFWITSHDHFEANSRACIKVRPGENYIYDAWVGPVYRNKGIMYYIMNDFFRKMLMEDKERVIFVLALVSNRLAVKMFLRLNFHPASLFRIRRRFGIQRQIWEPVPPGMLKALPANRSCRRAVKDGGGAE